MIDNDYEMIARIRNRRTARHALLNRLILVLSLTILVLFEAFQSVAIVEHTARLDILEAPPEIVYPNIAIDMTVPQAPLAIRKHKTSLKHRTKAILEAHNDSN